MMKALQHFRSAHHNTQNNHPPTGTSSEIPILDCRIMLAATKVMLPASSDHSCTFTTFNNGGVSHDNSSTSMDPVDDRRRNQFNVRDSRARKLVL
jgi:hypothetical protein